MIDARQRPASNRGLVDVREVARLADCSTRHVFRLVERGLMPAPVKVGRLTRFRREQIERWISDGCPPARTGGRP